MIIDRITATVRNPADPTRAWEGRFRVDTDAVDCRVPQQYLEAIGLVLKGRRVYWLNGAEIDMGFTTGEIELMGEIAGTTIIWGAPDSEPLLGITALESIGVEIDHHNQTLHKLPSVMPARLLIELDWEKWDQEIEEDSAAGHLDFLIEEAKDAKAHGTLREL